MLILSTEYQHSQDTFPNSLAINVGTFSQPTWYPSELLQILPNQSVRDLLPGSLGDRMNKESCRLPHENFGSIVGEGLPALGFPGIQHRDRHDLLLVMLSKLMSVIDTNFI